MLNVLNEVCHRSVRNVPVVHLGPTNTESLILTPLVAATCVCQGFRGLYKLVSLGVQQSAKLTTGPMPQASRFDAGPVT